jgi:hypothetical protein
MEFGSRGGHQITERVGGIIAAETFLIGVGLEDVGGVVGIMLEIGEGVDEPLTALMNEEFRGDTGGGVAEEILD